MARSTKQSRAKKHSFAGKQDGEEVILVEHRHPIVLRRQLIIGMLVILVIILPWAIATANVYDWQVYANWFLLFGMFGLAFYWFRAWVGWYYSVYVLTTYRIMIVEQRGFFSREVSELALTSVQNVNYKIKGIQASMFGFGDISIDTLSGSDPLQLKTVHKPVRYQQAVLEVIRREGLDK